MQDDQDKEGQMKYRVQENTTKNPGGGEIFRTRPDRSCGPLSLLYSGCRVSFPGVKRPGRGANHPPPSSTEVKERVELYHYYPCGVSWLFYGELYLFLPNSICSTVHFYVPQIDSCRVHLPATHALPLRNSARLHPFHLHVFHLRLGSHRD